MLAPENMQEITDGEWQTEPRGDGDEPRGDGDGDTPGERQSSASACGNGGTFGILCGNWGGNWSEQALQRHMDLDLKSGACSIIILQEAKHELLMHLRAPGAEGIKR